MDWDPSSGPKLDFEEDYYSVLEISTSALSEDIKKAFYRLVGKYHPDGKESPEEKSLGNKQMMVINNAYRILRDAQLREEYDAQRRLGRVGAQVTLLTYCICFVLKERS